jgi:hypothetical protein
MHLTHEQGRAFSDVLTQAPGNPANVPASMTLATLVAPGDVVRSLVSVEPGTGATHVVLLTRHSLVHGEFPPQAGPIDDLTHYEPTIWVAPISELAGVQVGAVQLAADKDGVTVHPTYVLHFKGEAGNIRIPSDNHPESLEGASLLVRELMDLWSG